MRQPVIRSMGAHNIDIIRRRPDMIVKTQVLERSARVALSGRFDFKVYRDFKEAYTPLLDNGAVHEIEIDLGKVDYMDSAALGMLLLLKERADSRPITLVNAYGVVSRLLEVANFDRIFSVRSMP